MQLIKKHYKKKRMQRMEVGRTIIKLMKEKIRLVGTKRDSRIEYVRGRRYLSIVSVCKGQKGSFKNKTRYVIRK